MKSGLVFPFHTIAASLMGSKERWCSTHTILYHNSQSLWPANVSSHEGERERHWSLTINLLWDRGHKREKFLEGIGKAWETVLLTPFMNRLANTHKIMLQYDNIVVLWQQLLAKSKDYYSGGVNKLLSFKYRKCLSWVRCPPLHRQQKNMLIIIMSEGVQIHCQYIQYIYSEILYNFKYYPYCVSAVQAWHKCGNKNPATSWTIHGYI